MISRLNSSLPLGWLPSANARAMHRFVLVRSIAAAIAFLGCVPTAHYEEAQSAAAVAEEARRRQAEELASAQQELERLQAEYAEAKERLGQYDAAIAQAAFERTTIETQRDQHAELVTHLRGELARVGDHLQVFSNDRSELNERLQEAQAELERLQDELSALRARVQDTSLDSEPRDDGQRADSAQREAGQGDAGEAEGATELEAASDAP